MPKNKKVDKLAGRESLADQLRKDRKKKRQTLTDLMRGKHK